MALINTNMLTMPARAVLSADRVPVGAILAFAAVDHVPPTYLLCDGREVSRTAYAALFLVIGTTYGEGNGVDTFNLPNLMDNRFPEGAAVVGETKEPGLPNITGKTVAPDVYRSNMFSGTTGAFTRSLETTSEAQFTASSGSANKIALLFDASRCTNVYGASDTVQPKALTVAYIIKAVDGQGVTTLLPHITAFALVGDTVTCAMGDVNIPGVEAPLNTWQFNVPSFGVYTLSCTNGEKTRNVNVHVNIVGEHVLHVSHGLRLGYRIRKADPDPASAVEYMDDAVGMRPAHMDYDNNMFDYGDWGGLWFMADNKPCMLTYTGQVDYYLNTNDYSLRANGGTSDVSNTSYQGNAMAQFPLVYVKRWEDENYWYESISDIKFDDDYLAYAHTRADGSIANYVYTSMFTCSGSNSQARSLLGKTVLSGLTMPQEISSCEANGNLWYQSTWTQHELLRTLLYLISKSRDSKTSFGTGNLRGNNSVLTTGTLATTGQFFGYSDATHQVKVFHTEAPWGDTWRRTAGILTINNVVHVKMTRENGNYDTNPSETLGWINTGLQLPATSTVFVSAVKCCKWGMIPTATNGTIDTYFCAPFWANTTSSSTPFAMYTNTAVNYTPTVGGGIFVFNMSNAATEPSGWNGTFALSCEQPA